MLVDVPHYVILDGSRLAAERFVFMYSDGTVNEVFIVSSAGDKSVSHVALCGDHRPVSI